MSKAVGSSTGAEDLEKLIHDLEFENRQYVKEIEKERQRLTAAETKLTEHKEEAENLQKEIHLLDEATKNYHKQFTLNRDNIESLRKTVNVLEDHEEALQRDFKLLQEKSLKQREDWSQTLAQYRATWKDYKETYENMELAKRLRKEQGIAKEKEKALKSLRLQRENIKTQVAKVQAEQRGENFIPYTNLKDFVLAIVEMKTENNCRKKDVQLAEQSKDEIKAKINVLQKQINIKRQEEEKRKEEERQKALEEARKEDERKQREEEEKRRQLQEEEERKKKELEERRKEQERKRAEDDRKNSSQQRARSNQYKSKSIPQIAIPMFNYSKYRNTTLSDQQSNTSTESSFSVGRQKLRAQPVVSERPALPCSPPVSYMAMANSNLPLLRKVQESELQKKAMDVDSKRNETRGQSAAISSVQTANPMDPKFVSSYSGETTKRREETMEIESRGDASNDAVGTQGDMETEEFPTWSKDCKTPDRHLTIQTSKSPFDIEKHRARVASIQKSPDGFAFSKRDMHIAGSGDTAREPSGKPIFASPLNPTNKSKQASPTANTFKDSSDNGNLFSGANNVNTFGGNMPFNFGSENSGDIPKNSGNPLSLFGDRDESDSGGNIFSMFGGGDNSNDASDSGGFSFNFGSTESDKPNSSVFSMF